MTSAKKISKKSLSYVRPVPGSFELEKFPGHEFRFRKITLDDEAWCVEKLGASPFEIMSRDKVQASELCRLYFHFLVDSDKERFFPIEEEVTDYDTGEKKKEVVAGWKRFMRSIDGGSITEMLLIARAFAATIFASRPITDLPDELKKSLLNLVEKAEKKKEMEKAEKPVP
jgi:hypothetical protein